VPKSKRRSGLTGSVVRDLVKDAEERQRAAEHTRDRSWDTKRIKATYDLPAELKEEIRTIAENEDLLAYEIARAFLECGLARYREGGLEALGLEKSPKPTSYTLFAN